MTKNKKADSHPMKVIAIAAPRGDQFGGPVKSAAVEVRLRFAEAVLPGAKTRFGRSTMLLFVPAEAEGNHSEVDKAVFSVRNGIGIRSKPGIEKEAGLMAELYGKAGCDAMGWAVIAKELDRMYISYDIFDLEDGTWPQGARRPRGRSKRNPRRNPRRRSRTRSRRPWS